MNVEGVEGVEVDVVEGGLVGVGDDGGVPEG